MIGKKEEILTAGAVLFGERGYHLSISDLAKKVSIKPPSIYSHFQSKDEIIEKIVDNEIKKFYFEIFSIIRSLETTSHFIFKEQLEYIFWGVMGYFDHIEQLRFWQNIELIENEILKEKCKHMIREYDAELREKLDKLFQVAIEHHEIRGSVNEGHILLLLVMIRGLLNGLYMSNDSAYRHERAQKIWNAYWDSIKADAATD